MHRLIGAVVRPKWIENQRFRCRLLVEVKVSQQVAQC